MPGENNKVLIVGIGNEFRSDDGAGIVCARKLNEKLNSNIRVIENDGDGASLIESWKGFDKVILIDSVSIGSKPGTIHNIEAAKTEFPKQNSVHSSHLFSVAEAIETAKVLNKLPEKLIVYGIEGKSYELGSKISDEVNSAIEKLVTEIQKEINKMSSSL
jgi:hydrogenase maturation protease